jgi:hypothetical protein
MEWNDVWDSNVFRIIYYFNHLNIKIKLKIASKL